MMGDDACERRTAVTEKETVLPGGGGSSGRSGRMGDDGGAVVVLFYRYFPGPVHSLLLPRVDGDGQQRTGKEEPEGAGPGGDENDGASHGERVRRSPAREPLSLLRDRIRALCRCMGGSTVDECTSNSSSNYEKKEDEEGEGRGFGTNPGAAVSKATMRGRILLSAEGINGTLSAPCRGAMDEFIRSMEGFDLTRMLSEEGCVVDGLEEGMGKIFAGIDWKVSSNSDDDPASARPRKTRPLQPFPDLKISLVKEIVSSGGTVTLSDLERCNHDRRIRHLSPEQFHEALREDGVALIDVRNTFEYSIGRFYDSSGNEAIDPCMTKFSSFDNEFVSDPRTADLLREKKKVLMYCTGGIRCEKASVMLRRRHDGIDPDGGGALEGKEICVLEGGIHRYLERYGSGGFFRGKNFVFDQRVAVDPASLTSASVDSSEEADEAKTEIEAGRPETDEDAHAHTNIVVGRCIECSRPHDELSGAIVCSVCRDLVLVCPSCRVARREYHCARHAYLRDCYYTFLEPFDRGELEVMLSRLVEEREKLLPPQQPMPMPTNGGGTSASNASRHKNVRRTLLRQINKVRGRIDEIDSGTGPPPDPNCPRRCRTCWSTEDECDGLCWGFWKRSRGGGCGNGEPPPQQLPIEVGDVVEPGPNWNGLKLGDKSAFLDGAVTGRVVERKSWGSSGGGDDVGDGGEGVGWELDCVAVVWERRCGGSTVSSGERNGDTAVASSPSSAPESTLKRKVIPSRLLGGRPEIYRWGVVTPNGKRMYDLQRKATSTT